MFILETNRLFLRDFNAEDFEAVHSYACIEEVSQYEPWGPNTPEETQGYLKAAIQSSKVMPRVSYEVAVILKDTGKLIGSGRVGIDVKESQQASLGYVIVPPSQGQGFATEVATALIKLGFEQLNPDLIFATCDVLNVASKRVLEKVGMQQTGLIKNHMRLKERVRDSYRFEVKRNPL